MSYFSPAWMETKRHVRNFWRGVALVYWHDLWLSPKMLLHSLQDWPKDLHFHEGERASELVKESPEFREMVRSLARTVRPGRVDGLRGIVFTSRDLNTSIHQAEMHYEGRICRREDGTCVVDMDYDVRDRYDFRFFFGPSEGLREMVTMTGNNHATVSQWLGAIVPYWCDITFHDRREVER